MKDLFFNRTDTYGYYLPPEPGKKASGRTAKTTLTDKKIEQYLKGEISIGAHCLSAENTCKWVAWDFDTSKQAKEEYLQGDDTQLKKEKKTLWVKVLELVGILKEKGIIALLEDSVGGYHIWVFFQEQIEAELAYNFVWSFGDFNCEMYPKQKKLSKEQPYGNWLRLPGRYHSTEDMSFCAVSEDDNFLKISLKEMKGFKVGTEVVMQSTNGTKTPKEISKIVETSKGQKGPGFHRAILEVTGSKPGVLNRYDTWLKFLLGCKAENLPYDGLVDQVCRASENYDYEKNKAKYAGLVPMNITFGSNHFLAENINPGMLKALFAEYGDTIDKRPTTPANLTQATAPATPLTSWYTTSQKGKIGIDSAAAARAYADTLVNNPLLVTESEYFQYQESKWVDTGIEEIKALIRAWLVDSLGNKNFTQRVITDIASQVCNICFSANTKFDENLNLINLENGVLDLSNYKLLSHDSGYYQRIQLNFAYNPGATCPTWQKYLNSLDFSLETLKRLQELAGYACTPDTRLEKATYFLGLGSNGKSIFLETIASVLGANVSRIDPGILGDRFQAIQLRGKLLNICSDIDTRKLLSAAIKGIISGEPIYCDIKGRAGITFKPTVKLMFSSNKLLITRDKSVGFYRRFDVLRWTKIFKGKERDKNLKNKLLKELPGVFNWCLGGLKRLRENDYNLTQSLEFDAAKEEFERDTNPLRCFCETFVRGSELLVECNIFRDLYLVWCKNNGFHPLNSTHLGREMVNLNYGKKRLKLSSDEKRKYYYIGLAEDGK